MRSLSFLDGDGKVELVVGHTDKFVTAYRWQPSSSEEKSASQQSFASFSIANSYSSLNDATMPMRKETMSSSNEDAACIPPNGDSRGRFVPVYGWRLEHIVSTIHPMIISKQDR